VFLTESGVKNLPTKAKYLLLGVDSSHPIARHNKKGNNRLLVTGETHANERPAYRFGTSPSETITIQQSVILCHKALNKTVPCHTSLSQHIRTLVTTTINTL
jgi:hypothetical protein